MIKLKPKPQEPNSLRLEKVLTTIQLLEEKVNSGQKPTTKDPNDFPAHWLPEARAILWRHQDHKCCYCEIVIPKGSKANFYSGKEPKYDNDIQVGIEYINLYLCENQEECMDRIETQVNQNEQPH